MLDNLSVDSAVEALNDAPEAEDAPEIVEATPEPETKDEAPPEAEGDDGAETPTEVEDEEQPEPETAVEAPHFWSAEDKAKFAKLPVDLQELILSNDKEAERTVNRKQQEAAAARKDAEAQIKALEGLTGRISEAAERAEDVFADRWSKFTPEAWIELAKTDPNKYTQLKAQHDAERDAVQRAKTAKDAASEVSRQKWVAEQETTLKTLAPELADPKTGAAKRAEVADYLRANGVPEQALDDIGALEVTMAWKAMQFDRGRASLKPSKPAAEKAPVRPAASAPQSSQSRALADAEARFKKSGSVEDAVRVLNLKG